MKYVDGYVLVVPKRNIEKYKKMAIDGGKLWKKYGALSYFECIGDDLNPFNGKFKIALFPKVMKIKPNETVIFSFIIFKSKEDRNKINAKVMKDPLMNDPEIKNPMPFDMKKMTYGGFNVIVEK